MTGPTLLAASASDHEALIAGTAPCGLALPATPIAPPEVLAMLAGVAAEVGKTFTPASWLIIDQGTVAGLCSVTRPPDGRTIDIGYGVAPCCQGKGLTTRAVGELAAWARTYGAVDRITAETSPANIPSQRVLSRNGFVQTGERVDPEDGPLICWSLDVSE